MTDEHEIYPRNGPMAEVRAEIKYLRRDVDAMAVEVKTATNMLDQLGRLAQRMTDRLDAVTTVDTLQMTGIKDRITVLEKTVAKQGLQLQEKISVSSILGSPPSVLAVLALVIEILARLKVIP